MEITQKTPISISEISDIVSALIKLLKTFPELPAQIEEDGILFEQLRPKNIGMCLSTLPGSVRQKTYICGKYIARYNFKILLQKMSVSNTQRIDAVDVLGKIGAWLEKTPIEKDDGTSYQLQEYPALGENRKILEIRRTSFPRIVERLEPNIEISEAAFYLDFEVAG